MFNRNSTPRQARRQWRGIVREGKGTMLCLEILQALKAPSRFIMHHTETGIWGVYEYNDPTDGHPELTLIGSPLSESAVARLKAERLIRAVYNVKGTPYTGLILVSKNND